MPKTKWHNIKIYAHALSFSRSLPPYTEDMPKDAEYKLAQSGDATCNGLESAEVSF
jgi:hypothetical protein